ncbi:opioid growth factor receptor [Erpetoichthys calabaricus]|uniref:opioid growth factor receptor n=1 Tax=Erpetoichthys calabaricus TaxID=27687 RepID=UPI0022346747|nr:opioid growth factor receptor [Erpetoichthys calabaricus]
MSSVDDLATEYDSTWETEGEQDEDDSGGEIVNCWRPTRNERAARDMQNYRHGYPTQKDDEDDENVGDQMNVLFYQNKVPCKPDDVMIEEIHKNWRKNYRKLESNHCYIQWLFPLREPGMNYMAHELSKREIKEFKQCEEAKKRLLTSYKMMLGFYGIKLEDEKTGKVCRAENWEERFTNLDRNPHNNLRISRILKCLGELGFEHYQVPLVKFFLKEVLVSKQLRNMKNSVLDYFIFSVRDKSARRGLIEFAYQNFEPKDQFVWCPRKIQKRLKEDLRKKKEHGNDGMCSGRTSNLKGAQQSESHGEEAIGSSVDSDPSEEPQSQVKLKCEKESRNMILANKDTPSENCKEEECKNNGLLPNGCEEQNGEGNKPDKIDGSNAIHDMSNIAIETIETKNVENKTGGQDDQETGAQDEQHCPIETDKNDTHQNANTNQADGEATFCEKRSRDEHNVNQDPANASLSQLDADYSLKMNESDPLTQLEKHTVQHEEKPMSTEPDDTGMCVDEEISSSIKVPIVEEINNCGISSNLSSNVSRVLQENIAAQVIDDGEMQPVSEEQSKSQDQINESSDMEIVDSESAMTEDSKDCAMEE